MRPISASTRVSRKGARFSFVDNLAISAYIDFKERLPVNGSPFPVISDQSLVPVASALFSFAFSADHPQQTHRRHRSRPDFRKTLDDPAEGA